MNATVPASRQTTGHSGAPASRARRHLFVLALWAGVCAGPFPGPARAEAPGGNLSARAALQQADEFYRQDQFLKAEQLYRQALDGLGGVDRRRCFERLLAIYTLSGRQDQAIQVGLRYEPWLLRGGDEARARGLALDIGEWYLNLGHHAAAIPPLERALQGQELPPAKRLVALTYLAYATEKQGARRHVQALVAAAGLTYLAFAAEEQGERSRPNPYWRQVEKFAGVQLGDAGKDLDPRQRILFVYRLSDCYRLREDPDKACDLLSTLLPVLKNPVGKRDTLRRLAGHLVAKAPPDLRRAEEALREALKLHERHQPDDPLTRADLASALADVLRRQDKDPDAEYWQAQAERDYQAVLRGYRGGRHQVADALAAFWKLQMLYRRTSQYKQALDLTTDRDQEWSGRLPIESRLKADKGSLQAILSKFKESRPLLRAAVADLDKRWPRNLIELPPLLLTLGVVELELGERLRAEELGKQCRDLYKEYRLADDAILVETYNLLGTCAAQRGDYDEAIKEHFRKGIERCKGLGKAAAPQQSNLLLNIALLHKAQGDLDQALHDCKDARDAYRAFAKPDALGFAYFDAAEAGMLAAQGKESIDEAYRKTGRILELCRKYNITDGLLVVTARHCQALYHLRQAKDFLRRKEYARAEGALKAAETTWQGVLKLHEPVSPLRPRTLNYLGLTREWRGEYLQAEKLYLEARRLQERDPKRQAFPVTHFITLWRLANVAERQGRKDDARALLEKAVQGVDEARLRTYGDDRQRAKFFAQFATAFEQLVEWGVRDGKIETAVTAAARGRSRTLLDQLQMAGVDPLEGVPEPKRQQLRDEDKKWRQRIAGRRARAMLIPAGELEEAKAQELRAELDQAEQEYTKVRRQILDASRPVYRSLAEQDFSRTLGTLRAQALGPKVLLLVYHVGPKQSYLLMLGGRSGTPKAFPLTVPAGLAGSVAPPEPLPLVAAPPGGRGLRRKPAQPQPKMPPPLREEEPTAPLNRSVLRALVESYLQQVWDPTFQPTRGLRLHSSDPKRKVPDQRPELLADVLLPPEAREHIRKEDPQCLVVVPDGALHRLPFEALVLKSGANRVYALDELPPIAYAPSVAILALLVERQVPPGDGQPSLLTVGNPAYPKGGRFHPLNYSATESQRIKDLFAGWPVVALQQHRATKEEVVANLLGRRIVHIAAHGLAEDRSDNKFGALALTPPPGEEALADASFLSLHEIYNLPLRDCELAVLSACDTNVGPPEPLEAGVTLASAFLAAGAHRVVASHWEVHDESTADLMVAFFREVTAAARQRKQVSYPLALQKARRQVRAQAKWSAPCYWSPFVLVGPPD
jgi:CHAT domain-containing protein/tetratricopeptide (TPR) repeat protein